MLATVITFFSDYTVQVVVSGAVVLGMVSGILGSFAVLRQQSLLGDAMSHAALPGIALAFLLTGTKLTLVLLLGAIISGWIGTLFMMLITKQTGLKQDAALGIVLSVFFGFGLVLLTYIQKLPMATQSGLNTFLFGNAATMLVQDVVTMLGLGICAVLILAMFWKEFKAMTFDIAFSRSLGIPVRYLDVLLTTLIVVAIVIGLQAVGVVLMSAMVIAPAVAARQWTDRLILMVMLSAFFGAVSGVIGVVLSSLFLRLPTGPTIVVVVSVFVLISLLFAPNRGLIFAYYRHYAHRIKLRSDRILTSLLLFSESHTDPFHPHDIAALRAIGLGGLDRSMMALKQKGLVVNPQKNFWALTQTGLKTAQKLKKDQEGLV